MKLHQIKGYIQDIYLAEYSHGLLLLDGGSRADVDNICEFIQCQLQRPLTDLKLVISTHMHPDHAGAVHHLKQRTGCQIASANVEGHWYRGLDGWLMFLTDLLLARYIAKRQGKPRKNIWYQRHLTPDIYLNDEQVLPYFDDWVSLFTQGHTDRCLSLYHRPTEQIYVADLMVKVKGRYIPPFPVFYPNRYKESLGKLKKLAPAYVLLAHGGKIELSEDEFAYLYDKAPTTPVTHWRSVKAKLLTVLGR